MPEVDTPPKVGTQLSYSSSTLLKNCSQKYYFHKIAEDVQKDSDSEDNYDAFNIGKAFHWILEENLHSEERLDTLIPEAVKAFEVEESESMIHAMVLRYLQVHKKSGLKVVFCELQLDNPIFIGFIDAIMKDAQGNWWIVDLKTSARYSPITTGKLASDTQLNLYSSFAVDVAKNLNLDPKKFAGARYRTTTKSKLKKKPGESYSAHVKRTAKNVVSYDIIIPVEKMNPQATYEEHERLHAITMKMREGKVKPQKNLSYCDSFFKPCEYWSQCHGDIFSKAKDQLEILKSDNG